MPWETKPLEGWVCGRLRSGKKNITVAQSTIKLQGEPPNEDCTKISKGKLDTLELAVCPWCVAVPVGTGLGDGFSVEPQHKLPGLESISDPAMQDCRSSEGKTKVVQITQIGNGGSHRYPVGWSLVSYMSSCLQVVVVSLNESSGCFF